MCMVECTGWAFLPGRDHRVDFVKGSCSSVVVGGSLGLPGVLGGWD